MKNTSILLFVLLFCSVQFASAQFPGPYQSFEIGETYSLIGNNVNVRVQPDPKSKAFAKLLIGTKVKVLELGSEHEIDGVKANWVKVSFAAADKESEGYVWGGLMAAGQIESLKKPDVTYLFGASRVDTSEYRDKFLVQIRAERDKKDLGKLEFEAVGTQNTRFDIQLYDDPGLAGIREMVMVRFSDGFCGGYFGNAYLGWTGSEWIHILTTTDGIDAPYVQVEELIFPNDEGGIPGKIIMIERSNEEAVEKEAEDLNEMTTLRRIEFKWDGKALERPD